MALRAENSSSGGQPSSSHPVCPPVSWNHATAKPSMDWDKWMDLFQVAMMANYSISELTKEVTQQIARVKTLMGDLDEDPAYKTVISAMHLALNEATRK